MVHSEYATAYASSQDFKSVFEQAQGGHKSYFAILGYGLLYKGMSLCIPEGGDKIHWIKEAHTSRVHGHFGITKTLLNLQRYV